MSIEVSPEECKKKCVSFWEVNYKDRYKIPRFSNGVKKTNHFVFKNKNKNKKHKLNVKKGATEMKLMHALKADDPEYVHLWAGKYNHFEEKKTKIKLNWVCMSEDLGDYRNSYVCGDKIPIFEVPFPDELNTLPSYYIMDNGCHYFLVFVNGDSELYIYKRPYNVISDDDDDEKKEYYNELVKKYNTEKIWIGKHTIQRECELCPKCDNYVGNNYWNPINSAGNSILACLGGNRYLYIGMQIHEFDTPDNDKIIKYYSMIGNNDVPYPIALGEKYVYNGCHEYLPIEAFDKWNMTDEDWEERAARLFYNTDEDRKLDEKYKSIPVVPNIKIIHERM
uniref:Uncharacterized protein n=1 Tax=viral metagenome TaxID=1070528 RepID=A0A6C0E8Y1_9ZZZZ